MENVPGRFRNDRLSLPSPSFEQLCASQVLMHEGSHCRWQCLCKQRKPPNKYVTLHTAASAHGRRLRLL